MNAGAYEVKDLVVGQIAGRQQTVRSALMPRADFLELVESTIADLAPRFRPEEETIEEVRKTARTMPRFPFGHWMTHRGCGCVIGELLVAREQVEQVVAEQARMSVVEAVRSNPHDPGASVDALLARQPDSRFLIEFGTAIDLAVKYSVRREADGWTAESAEFIDDQVEP